MPPWKLPPKAKIYEALSAIADGRVTFRGSQSAEVISSSGEKTYLVRWSEDGTRFTSNDNASYWQGYLGYPILAVLLERGMLAFDRRIAELLAGVSWKEYNQKFRNDYERAVSAVLDDVEAKGGSRQSIADEVERIWAQVQRLNLGRLPQRTPPPK